MFEQTDSGEVKLNTKCVPNATLFGVRINQTKVRSGTFSLLLVYCFSLPIFGQTNSQLPVEILPIEREKSDSSDLPLTQSAQDLDADPRSVLMSGPMHEAFLEVYEADPKPNEIVLKTPPEPIDELPPDVKPEGLNVQWIPGYWAWDFDKKDFVWVSGLWRDFPPDRKWIPGYWQQVDEGFRWVSGFWQKESVEEIEYLPAPPESIESGPSSVAPGEDYFYVPGNWTYRESRYRWSPGYWLSNVDNWIWVPARYVWSPQGCVYRPGYWDHAIDQRGVVFAPRYYSSPIYQVQGYQYVPRFAINVGVELLPHLFVNLRHGHYYYGDWYGARFQRSGIHPWVNAHRHYDRYYDPLFAYYACPTRRYNQRNTFVWARSHHLNVSNNLKPRPSRNFVAPKTTVAIGIKYNDYVNKRRSSNISGRTSHSHMSFRRLNSSDRQAEVKRMRPIDQLRVARRSHESRSGKPSVARNPISQGKRNSGQNPGSGNTANRSPGSSLASRSNGAKQKSNSARKGNEKLGRPIFGSRTNPVNRPAQPKLANGVPAKKKAPTRSLPGKNPSVAKGNKKENRKPFILAPRTSSNSVARDVKDPKPMKDLKPTKTVKTAKNQGPNPSSKGADRTVPTRTAKSKSPSGGPSLKLPKVTSGRSGRPETGRTNRPAAPKGISSSSQKKNGISPSRKIPSRALPSTTQKGTSRIVKPSSSLPSVSNTQPSRSRTESPKSNSRRPSTTRTFPKPSIKLPNRSTTPSKGRTIPKVDTSKLRQAQQKARQQIEERMRQQKQDAQRRAAAAQAAAESRRRAAAAQAAAESRRRAAAADVKRRADAARKAKERSRILSRPKSSPPTTKTSRTPSPSKRIKTVKPTKPVRSRSGISSGGRGKSKSKRK